MAKNELVSSVVKLVSLFEALATQDEMALSDISNTIKVHKSTAYRFLTSLKELGYVKQNAENEKYSLTLRLFEVGAEVLARLDEKEAARPVMKKLAEQTQETVHLGMLDGEDVVYIDKIDSPQTLRMYSKIGLRSPAYCTAIGKALLAWAPSDVITHLVGQENAYRFTDYTLVEPYRIREELHKIKERGYAEDNEEHEMGVCCIAAPIRNMAGEVTAAISVAMPTLWWPLLSELLCPCRSQAISFSEQPRAVLTAQGKRRSNLGRSKRAL